MKSYKNYRIKDFPATTIDELIEIKGRIVQKRDLGNLIFLQIFEFDYSGNNEIAQISLSKQYLTNFTNFKHLKRGDIIQTKGFVYNSKTNEKTLQVEDLQILQIATINLPDKWHGLQDELQTQSIRYIDNIINEKTRNILRTRFTVLKTISKFFEEREFQQVETPILGKVASGAAANPFKTHHDTLNMEMFLRIAPELNLKRYIVAGFPKVFEIAKCFRNEGMDTTHLQEFTMVEAYCAYMSYEDLMQICTDLLQQVLKATNYSCKTIPRIKYEDFITKYLGINKQDWFNEDLLREIASTKNINISNCKSTMGILDKLYKKLGLIHIKEPTIIYDYPRSPLAKANPEDSATSKQFQVIFKNIEVIKACLEMDDAKQQKQNFQEQINLSKTGEQDTVDMDNDYIKALEYGMPPTAGLGMGIDRIIQIVTQSESIKDTIMFPIINNL